MGPLVLASRSPQRRAILEQLMISFEVLVPEVDEVQSGPPAELATRNACRKAVAVASRRSHERVLGVDTVVCIGMRVYGKPADVAEARATLTALSGRTHRVISGVCLIEDGEPRTATAVTEVQFRSLEGPLLEWYLTSEEWRERAGGYAIQGAGVALVRAIVGDYSNVVGLPVTTLLELAPDLLGR